MNKLTPEQKERIEKGLGVAMGVSQWAEQGRKYNYWQFFERRFAEKITGYIKEQRAKQFDPSTILMHLENEFLLEDILK